MLDAMKYALLCSSLKVHTVVNQLSLLESVLFCRTGSVSENKLEWEDGMEARPCVSSYSISLSMAMILWG